MIDKMISFISVKNKIDNSLVMRIRNKRIIFLLFRIRYAMLHIKDLSDDHKDSYKILLAKWKDNPDAIQFLRLLDQTDDCCFLTGKAGTGKSTLIKDIIEFCKEIDKPPLVL